MKSTEDKKNINISIGIITLNAKYVHSSLSLRYLRNAARDAGYTNVWIEEFVINLPTWKIAAEIQKHNPDVLGVSIYIWNRHQSFELIEHLKKQNPNIRIAIGGPEVSFEKTPHADCTILAGEGEAKWVEYLDYVRKDETPSDKTIESWNAYNEELPPLTPAYLEEDLPNIKGRIVYMETSRGCPYLCSFCLSALDKSVRFFDDDIVQSQIRLLIDGGVNRIKFVDRTFNINPKRMQSFMTWLTELKGIEFHFEIVGDILNEDLLEFLKTVPEGMFQFEIGIQSVNESIQKIIQRKQDTDKLLKAVSNLIDSGKVHVHCDLIIGLPGETKEEFFKSFGDVLKTKPHELQLGFLKFLPGTPINAEIESHEYQFQSQPPYEFIRNKDLPAEEVIYLKMFAEVFDTFYNSKRFKFSIDRLLQTQPAFEIFDKILQYMINHDLHNAPHSLEAQYKIFHDVFEISSSALAMDLLKLDYLYSQRVYHLPKFLRIKKTDGSPDGTKTWRGDGRTPLIPFRHKIELSNSEAQLTPSSTLLYYAVAHPSDKSGYIQRPTIEAASN
jgi:radical SAM superfamily enzyme YgiQ (UPF0313 family)